MTYVWVCAATRRALMSSLKLLKHGGTEMSQPKPDSPQLLHSATIIQLHSLSLFLALFKTFRSLYHSLTRVQIANTAEAWV
jgi:hypothetical protein